ncbi:uncharacterized protein PHACADRAFT_265288 [Phanerochaete carnosa HHB-10118-sp]|uniref:NADP-dependent oxidoreductase domain-containing protein n=1 Tax=Phanerochaete carnosa (strain HHB-10118-sp) TaxID=650164 RepID=K5VSZ4_PHACS|nr:uncharacterized protein PHACADRAFT_265288 [Phanerochaete carnosa HHB-10118-sp]EKM49704.1 hypothetical protein PHACADRAFT_265288 [Phanerochaete carnosa HHB-10118-sp]
MSTRVPLVLGAGQFGAVNTGERVSNPAVAQELVDLMVNHGYTGIDTSRAYCDGTSEKFLSGLDLKGVARIDSKVYSVNPGDHSPEKVKGSFKASVEALNGKKIRVYYLHIPDRSVPFEDTLEAVNDIYKAGGFEVFGLSNYMAFEVAEIVGICKLRGFVMPTVYQGVYNLIDRLTEDELFPCLRKFNIKFAAYTPLAGGYLTERFFIPNADNKDIPLSKFGPDSKSAWFYTGRYYPAASAVAELKEVSRAHGLTLNEVALRWLQWHSKLQPEDLGVIVGASKKEQLQTTLDDSAKGPLPDAVVEACDATWKKARGAIAQYWI